MDLQLLAELAKSKGDLALVTIVEVKGSAPRHPGTAMLVRASGSIAGTVGGGRGESMAMQAGLAAIKERHSSLLAVEMLGDDAEGAALICGGINKMLVEYVESAAPYMAAEEIVASGRRAVLVKRFESAQGGGLEVAVFSEDGSSLATRGAAQSGSQPIAVAADPVELTAALKSGKSRLIEAERLFYDPILPEEKLLILGGGHVGKAPRRYGAGPRF